MTENKIHISNIPLHLIAYTFALLIALGLRFALIGQHPLNNVEASLALQALATGKGQAVSLSGEPGYLGLTALIFFIFGGSDFWARFTPALIGSISILVPLLFRPWLGNRVSLLLAFLIALDPVLISASRAADGRVFALFGLLAGIGFLLKKKPVLGGICLGIALSGGPGVWTGILILVGMALVSRFPMAHNSLEYPTNLSKNQWVKVIAGTAVTLVVISTQFFTYPAGISAAGSSLAEYFTSFGETAGNIVMGSSAAWLLVELPFIILALWGLIDGLVRKDELARLPGVWWGLGLVLTLVTTASGTGYFYWVSIPILVLTAIKVNDLTRQSAGENRIVFLAEAFLVFALIIFSFLNLLALVNNPALTPDETRNRIIGALLPLILLVVLTILLSWGWSASSTRKGFIAGVMVMLSLMAFSNAWKASGLGSKPQYEFVDYGGHPVGSKTLKSTIADISRWNTGFENRIDIVMVALDQPSLRWALRDYENLILQSGYNPDQSPSLILTGTDQTISSSTSYRGQKFLWAVQPQFSAMRLTDWVKWAVFRTAPEEKTELILWARNDLFAGTTTE